MIKDLLSALHAHFNIKTDSQLANILRVEPSFISKLRKSKIDKLGATMLVTLHDLGFSIDTARRLFDLYQLPTGDTVSVIVVTSNNAVCRITQPCYNGKPLIHQYLEDKAIAAYCVETGTFLKCRYDTTYVKLLQLANTSSAQFIPFAEPVYDEARRIVGYENKTKNFLIGV
jgi:hypothetical protein